MQGEHWQINSDQTLNDFKGFLDAQLKEHKSFRCQVKTGKNRSLTKNALSHVWYAQLDKERFQDHEPGYARRYCKAHFGIPLLAEDEEFSEKYNRLIRKRYSYEEKLEMMEWFPVTSLMTEDQMSRYLHTMQHVFAPDGVILTTPKDSEYDQWLKSRK